MQLVHSIQCLFLGVIFTFTSMAAGETPAGLFEAAVKAYNQDDFSGARAKFASAQKVQPEQVHAIKLYLAHILREEGKSKEAVEAYRALVQKDDKTIPSAIQIEGQLGLFGTLVETGAGDEARNLLKDMTDPNTLPPRLSLLLEIELVRYLGASGQGHAVIDSLDDMIRKSEPKEGLDENSRGQMHLLIARGYRGKGDTAKARFYFQKVGENAELKPNLRAQALNDWGYTAASQENYKEAHACLNTTLKLSNLISRHFCSATAVNASVYAAEFNFSEAHTLFKQALKFGGLTESDRVSMLAGDMGVYLNEGDLKGAKAVGAEILKITTAPPKMIEAVKRVIAIAEGTPVPQNLASSAAPGEWSEWQLRLRSAVVRDNAEELMKLKTAGLDLTQAMDGSGTAALHLAAAEGRVKALKYLIEVGAPVDGRDADDRTPLMIAAQRGRLDAMQILIAQKAQCNLKDKHDWTALHFAAGGGFTDAVKLLLAQKMDINAAAEIKRTPLMVATINWRLETVKVLVEAGADIALKDEKDCTAWIYASRRNDDPVLDYLTAAQARATPLGSAVGHLRPPADENRTPAQQQADQDLVVAAMGGEVAKIKAALARGADLHTVGGEVPRTPLMWAVRSGSLDAVKVLIESGADVNEKDRLTGATPLDWASKRNNKELVDYLKGKGGKMSAELNK